MQRKQLMKPDIGRVYASLCFPHVPFTDLLFGDDLQKQLKDIGDVNKIGAKVQGHRGPHRPQTGYVNNNNSKGSFPTETSQKTRRAKPTDPGDTQGFPEVQHKQQEAISVAHEANTVNAVSNFVAGNIAKHISNWRSITTDPSILEIVSGYCIEFQSIPCQLDVPQITFSKGDGLIIAGEINKLLIKLHIDTEFISSFYSAQERWVSSTHPKS